MTDTIEIIPEQKNELYFNVAIEGTSVPDSVSVRLVCEAEDFGYVFKGTPSDSGEVRITIPPLPKGALQEGREYATSLEVYVDNKKHVPIRFNIKLPKSQKVTAEMVQKTQSVVNESTVKATMSSKQTSSQSEPVKKLPGKVDALKNSSFKNLVRIVKK